MVQLNFYSFRKLRDDSSKKSVRFCHTNFRRGHPELLQRIQRCTRVCDGSFVEIRSLKDDLLQMNMELEHLSSQIDSRLKEVKNAMEDDYQQRMARFALYYQALSQIAQSQTTVNVSPSQSRPDSPPKLINSNSPVMWQAQSSSSSSSFTSSAPTSPRSAATTSTTLSPLDTLSGVAALLRATESA
jgi:hypothetical protein